MQHRAEIRERKNGRQTNPHVELIIRVRREQVKFKEDFRASVRELVIECPGKPDAMNRVPEDHLPAHAVHLHAFDFENLLHDLPELLGFLVGHGVGNRYDDRRHRLQVRALRLGVFRDIRLILDDCDFVEAIRVLNEITLGFVVPVNSRLFPAAEGAL